MAKPPLDVYSLKQWEGTENNFAVLLKISSKWQGASALPTIFFPRMRMRLELPRRDALFSTTKLPPIFRIFPLSPLITWSLSLDKIISLSNAQGNNED